MFRTITITLAGALLLFTTGRGQAASLACLDDAGDAAALTAVRAQIDETCPCDSFVADGKKSAHGDYLACAKGVLKGALDAEQLRPKCRKLGLYAAVRSNCGYPVDPLRVPCLHATAKGFSCKITVCDASTDRACSAYTNCLGAADTNEDGQIATTDSGQCVPFQDCDAQYAQTPQRKDQYVNECFDGCMSNPDCFFGCNEANQVLMAYFDAELATCNANNARSCEDLHAMNQQYCATVGSPPSGCVDSCDGNETCVASCAVAADCNREVDDAYDACVSSTHL